MHNKIKKFDATKAAFRVAMFALFIKIQELITIRSKSVLTKQFHAKLKVDLECTSAAAFSKYKRKCRRIYDLVDILGKAGATLMALYITIHILENVVEGVWDVIIQKLNENEELKNFCNNIQQDDNQILPIFI